MKFYIYLYNRNIIQLFILNHQHRNFIKHIFTIFYFILLIFTIFYFILLIIIYILITLIHIIIVFY